MKTVRILTGALMFCLQSGTFYARAATTGAPPMDPRKRLERGTESEKRAAQAERISAWPSYRRGSTRH